MSHRLQSTRGVVLLLAIFVFQLGATRCRCLEHNGWLQTFSAALCASNSDDHGHSHDPVTSIHAGSYHHECLPNRDAYRPSLRGADLTQCDLDGVFAFLTDAEVDQQSPQACQLHEHELSGSLVLSVRAETQVYLL